MVLWLLSSSRTAALLVLLQVSLACEPLGLPPLLDDHRSHDSTQELVNFIVPSYQFSCRGLVTSWSACVDHGGDRERYEIHFQVWRPTSDGCFSLVGVNVPRDLLEPQDHCLSYTVPEEDQLEVSPGDVMGFYVDRYKLSRRGGNLEDPSGGGVQLDSGWSQQVHLLSVASGLVTGAGDQLCGPTQLLLTSVDSAPVLSASVDPISLPVTSPSLPVTSSSHPTTSPSLPVTSPSHPTTSSSLPVTSPSHPVTSPSLPVTSSSHPTTSTATERQLRESSSPLTPSPLPTLTTHTLTAQLSQMAPSTTPQPVHSSHSITSSETIPSKKPTSSSLSTTSSSMTSSTSSMTSSTSSMTLSSSVMSSPTNHGAPGDEGGLPPLLIGGLFMGGILLIAITALAVVLVMMLLWKPRSVVKGKVDCEDGEMVYCQAYEDRVNPNSAPQVGLVWNRAYNKCTVLEPEPGTVELENGNQTDTAEWGNGNEPEVKEPGDKDHLYDDVMNTLVCSSTHSTHNEYEEVY